jgi:hypothetical protein
MPDWEKLVSQRLAQLALDEGERQEVIAELAGHLEEIYESLRQRGASEDEAIRGALLEVENWKHLQQEIYVARSREDIMNARTARFWLPSIVTLGLSVITLVGFALVGLKPGPFGSHLPNHEIWWARLIGPADSGASMINEYTVWLMALPFIGAIGAYLSSRAGGRLAEIVISAVFPALAWLTIVVIVLSFATTLGHGVVLGPPVAADARAVGPVGPVGVITLLVLVPAACLLLGVGGYHVAAQRLRKSAA